MVETIKFYVMSKANVYEILTNRIIEGLQDKGLSWFRPWTNSNGDFQLPINNTTGKAYNGVNLFILGATATIEGYEHNEWITFKQAILLSKSNNCSLILRASS